MMPQNCEFPNLAGTNLASFQIFVCYPQSNEGLPDPHPETLAGTAAYPKFVWDCKNRTGE